MRYNRRKFNCARVLRHTHPRENHGSACAAFGDEIRALDSLSLINKL